MALARPHTPTAMKIIDAQLHLWGADSATRPWPRGGTPIPHRDAPWSADELLDAMDEAGVAAAILVPPGWEGDRNDLAIAAVQAQPERFAIMGRFDPLSDDPYEAFPRWREQPGMLGVRFTFHSARGRDLLLEPAMERTWAAAEHYGIPLMIRALPPMLDTVAGVAARYPALKLTLDHLAIPNGTVDEAAFAHLPALVALARYPNIALKATCMPAYTTDVFPYHNLYAPLRALVDAFGPSRVFWGSDLSRLPGTYRQCVEQWTEHMPWLDAAALDSIMGAGLATWLDWRRQRPSPEVLRSALDL